ncbi:hypothetical protein Arub01_22510 [Actinomadura rubrobrunea]|uniref:Uncharacterized protein n=1 Tax=Actinomadura rubrobrunea TaxID=115335 RepID=A0A9W6UW81_9ACTN|nr:hypothetical protein [Actinomadura rubrobrunea]GLW64007.1 hypothetical protein Arub01_22510 [Actinomadura rubrobrunea]
MTAPRRGWTVFCTEHAAGEIEAMPTPLHDAVIEHLKELARRGGAAIDEGGPPPGHPVDDGVAYTSTVPGHPVIYEYVVQADIREFRVTTIAWLP